MPDVFISYSRKDDENGFVTRLAESLKANGLDVWMDQEDIPQKVFDFLTGQQYVMKVINLRTGKLTDFNWRDATDTVNLVCSPDGVKSS